MFKRFFPDLSALEAFLGSLPALPCPRCHHAGAMKRHGCIKGYVSPDEKGIRAWRVYCNRKRGGCGHTPSVRLDSSLRHRCISTVTLSLFLDEWVDKASIREAWEDAGEPLSIDAARRILRGLRAATASLRTALSARAPPPEDKTGARNPSVQTLRHLRSVFGTEDPIRAYQAGVQLPFPFR